MQASPGFIYSDNARDNVATVLVPNLRPEERVELVLRRHWIVYVFLALWAFVPLAVTAGVLAQYSAIAAFVGTSLLAILLSMMWMVACIFLAIMWINQELDLFVITTNRVVGIQQLSFLNRSVSECSLAEVQEVDAQSTGLLANIFGYGAIYINTASERSNFVVSMTPDALENAREVLNVIEEYRRHLRPGAMQSAPSAVPSALPAI